MRSRTPDGFCTIPTATGGIARLACARMRELGTDVASVLAEVGARPEQVNDDAVRLEVPKQIRILKLASVELQDELLGFHLARNFDLREIGLVYYVIASSDRLADALLNVKRYSTIMNEGIRLNVRLDERAVAIAFDYVDIDRQSDRHQIEFWLVTLVRICRQVTDTRLAPRSLKFRHRRDETPAEMRSFFGCDVEFGADSDEVIFPAPVASLPIVGSDNYLNDLLLRYAEEALADRPQVRASLQSAIESVLPQLLPHAKVSASDVAQRLAISTRTLSRKLRDENVTFSEILEETRAALAKRYLAERDLPVTQIAWLLGYSEVSSFTHAFKRWTGMTPRQFR
ncbi:AraC family transcriptional regulator [Bradyrhizobium sp. JYMT SZCCT0428]|nr:AraC family transcriptional regulator [Bradyrhizobium sp. JYMT SZCCT0428]